MGLYLWLSIVFLYGSLGCSYVYMLINVNDYNLIMLHINDTMWCFYTYEHVFCL